MPWGGREGCDIIGSDAPMNLIHTNTAVCDLILSQSLRAITFEYPLLLTLVHAPPVCQLRHGMYAL